MVKKCKKFERIEDSGMVVYAIALQLAPWSEAKHHSFRQE